MEISPKPILIMVILLLLASLASACTSPAPLPVAATPAPAATATDGLPGPTDTASPTSTATAAPLPPTATFTATASLAPSATPTAEPTATVTLTPTAAATRQTGAALPGGSGSGVFVYLIAKNGAGKDGCGQAVRVAVPIQRSKDTDRDIEAALDLLFSMKSKYYGSLYNPVSFSTFRVQQIDYEEPSGGLTVWLSGKYRPTGDDCDNILVKSQIWSTAKQFGGISGTAFYINGPHPFGDFVSNDK